MFFEHLLLLTAPQPPLSYMSLKSDFTPLFPEEDAQHSSELQHQPSPLLPTVWRYPRDNLEQFHPLTPSPSAPLGLVQRAEPTPKAESSRGTGHKAVWGRQPQPSPSQCPGGTGVQPMLCPRGNGKGNALSREREQRQRPGSGHGKQERVGCSGNARSALLRGTAHSTARSYPTALTGAPRGDAPLSLPLPFTGVSVRSHGTGTRLPPLLALCSCLVLGRAVRAVTRDAGCR